MYYSSQKSPFDVNRHVNKETLSGVKQRQSKETSDGRNQQVKKIKLTQHQNKEQNEVESKSIFEYVALEI